ncbi:MAG TPA: hypothetical protein VHZ95_00135, partial [Polyangiales bacterium]|nr:hypothetical protein [Polyangiales bacterium]
MTIDGELRGIAMLRSCEIAVDARAFHAHSEAARFHAEVELRPGLNTVQARCQTEDQRELRSQAVHWDVRLRDAPLARAHASVVAGKLTLSAELRESESEPAPIV